MLEGLEKGISGQFKAELVPLFPDSIGGSGSTRRDSGFDCLLRSAEVTAEISCGDGVQS